MAGHKKSIEGLCDMNEWGKRHRSQTVLRFGCKFCVKWLIHPPNHSTNFHTQIGIAWPLPDHNWYGLTGIPACLLLLISMLWHRQAIFKSKGESSSAEFRSWTRVFGIESPADWMLADKPTELSRIELKTWTQQPVPMISEHSVHWTPLPFCFRTWLWRYTCLLLLISMLWHM